MKTPILVSAFAGILAGTSAGVADENQPISVPFDVSTGRPVVEVMINGQGPFAFIFDTGASGPVIRPDLVETLGLSVVGQGEVRSPLSEETMTVDRAAIETLSVNGAEVSDFEVLVVGMMSGPTPYQGVIGPSLFRDFGRVAFDFVEYELEFGGEFEDVPEGAWRPIGDFSPIIETGMIIGETEFPVHIDTGSPSILSVPRSLESTLPLTGPVQVIGRGRTVDTEFEIHGAPLDAVAELGEVNIPLQSVTFFDAPFGNLGMGGLHGLALEFDWETDRFALTGEAQPRAMRRGDRGARRRAPQEDDG